jgi:hypothetical protein
MDSKNSGSASVTGCGIPEEICRYQNEGKMPEDQCRHPPDGPADRKSVKQARREVRGGAGGTLGDAGIPPAPPEPP